MSNEDKKKEEIGDFEEMWELWRRQGRIGERWIREDRREGRML